MRPQPSLRRLIVSFSLVFGLSAALAYWITLEERQIEKRTWVYPDPPARDEKAKLGEDNLFYCPTCGEMIELDRSPLSIGRTTRYLRQPRELLERNDGSHT